MAEVESKDDWRQEQRRLKLKTKMTEARMEDD